MALMAEMAKAVFAVAGVIERRSLADASDDHNTY
jgi:hypothetical protein